MTPVAPLHSPAMPTLTRLGDSTEMEAPTAHRVPPQSQPPSESSNDMPTDLPTEAPTESIRASRPANSPPRSRRLSPGAVRCQSEFDTPLGRMLIARSDEGVCGVWFEGQKYHPGTMDAPHRDDDPVLMAARQAVLACFDPHALHAATIAARERNTHADRSAGAIRPASPSDGPATAAEATVAATPSSIPLLALDLVGTPFQQAVWRALCDIPAGTTVSYGTLARRLGRPEAVRAVAAAVGRNPVSLLIPCHRVVGADGHLTGYAGGLFRKQALLKLEQAQPGSGEGPLA